MVKAISVHKVGGPEALVYEDIRTAAARAGRDARHATARSGLNFIDVYHRTGLYPPPRIAVHPRQRGGGRRRSRSARA